MASVSQAITELAKFQLPWQEIERKQLVYCLEVASGKVSPQGLE